MLRLGDWVKVGDHAGAIQAWGVEIGISPKTNSHPIRRTSRTKAYKSGMPHLLVYFNSDREEWWPLEACIPIPPPLMRKSRVQKTADHD